MSTRSPGAPPTTVVVAIVASDTDGVSATLAAVRTQVYELASVSVVGGARQARDEAAAGQVEWVANLGSFLTGLDKSITHVWLVRAGALPRPDALAALVGDAHRSGASVAGSKVLSLDDPEALVSVGLATDVFDATYIGLDSDEVDQGQYDVIRDVAAVPGVSLLGRRDLLAGLGGIDSKLAPEAAAVDFCQRARLRGARIVVSPASEVLYPPAARRGRAWREDAGRIRAMAKVYGLVTLAWVLPMLFLIGLLEAIISPFLGRWKLFDWVRAWAWNVAVLPSTIRGRFAARRGRVAGDAELFRYQVRGSATLRSLLGDAAARIQQRLPGDYASVTELGRELRRPAFIVGVVAVLYVAMATRTIWRVGVPSAGFALPLPASSFDAVSAYAGGWNPAGFGGPDPLPPIVGFAGLLQAVLFNRPGLTMAVIVVVATLLGVWGTTRLMRTWSIGVVPGVIAGIVLMTGPATRTIAGGGEVATLAAIGILPWAMRVAVARMPGTWMGRLGRLAAVAWLVGLVGMLSPIVLPIPAIAVLVWAIVGFTNLRAWTSAAMALIGTGIGVWVLMPWLTNADLEAFLEAGEAFWVPDPIIGVALLTVALAATVAGPERFGLLAGWGAVLIGLGSAAARAADFGGGRQFELGGLVLVAVGTAVVIAVVGETVARWNDVRTPLKPIGAVAVLAAVVIVGAGAVSLVSGRLGLPKDAVGDALEFVAVADAGAANSRVLLLGSPDALPGESRAFRGLSYRVVSLPEPKLWEAWLPEPGVADIEFEVVLGSLFDGATSKVGSDLAAFGIRWVVVMDDTPLDALFEGQLDLVPLRGLDLVTFAVEAESPVRALASDGAVWEPVGNDYRGPADGNLRVFLADNANGRWGPDWQQVTFGNEVSARLGEASYRRIASRTNQAVWAGVLALGLLGLSWVGRRFR